MKRYLTDLTSDYILLNYLDILIDRRSLQMSRVAIAPAGVIGPEGDSGQHLPLNVKLVHTLGFAYDFHKRADS
jgi:hypothetical protein